MPAIHPAPGLEVEGLRALFFDVLQAAFASSTSGIKAELIFTRDSGPWVDRFWETLPAEIDLIKHKARAAVPREATVFYLNLIDDRSLVVSTEHVDRAADPFLPAR